MDSLWIGIITTLASAVILPVLTWWHGHRAGIIKAKADVREREEGRERAAYQAGLDRNAPRIATLEAENVECREFVSYQHAVNAIQRQEFERMHANLVRKGIELDPLLAMPDFVPHVSDPEDFKRRQGEALRKMDAKIAKHADEKAKEIAPPPEGGGP